MSSYSFFFIYTARILSEHSTTTSRNLRRLEFHESRLSSEDFTPFGGSLRGENFESAENIKLHLDRFFQEKNLKGPH